MQQRSTAAVSQPHGPQPQSQPQMFVQKDPVAYLLVARAAAFSERRGDASLPLPLRWRRDTTTDGRLLLSPTNPLSPRLSGALPDRHTKLLVETVTQPFRLFSITSLCQMLGRSSSGLPRLLRPQVLSFNSPSPPPRTRLGSGTLTHRRSSSEDRRPAGAHAKPTAGHLQGYMALSPPFSRPFGAVQSHIKGAPPEDKAEGRRYFAGKGKNLPQSVPVYAMRSDPQKRI